MSTSLLILTDFTPAADQALHYAAALAAPLGASLILLHIRRESLLDRDAFTGHIQHLSEGEVAAALEERTRGLAVPVQVESTVDGVSAAVADAAQRHQPALLVLGKPDTETTPDELVSSTSLTILRATRTPLLIIPINSTATVPPRRITIAADNNGFSLKPQTEPIRDLLHTLKPTVTLVHVVEPEENDECPQAHQAVLDSGLLRELPSVHTHGVRCRQIPQGILQGVSETQADMLLLIARRRSFLGQLFNRSVTSQVVLHGHVPVVLLPALD
ncbi:universal stress protein [Hymenobacter mucosus]|uniref:Nucleotide-binding universal stress protein, UspA family n=1 Tax=Hymenobacter mucosus TaxID=1411120 RepID=A0A239A6D4_9BACT|nr:universal stress protein [Hymenobacter mucosus]SNR91177.1 Nucleotide-binding universal stress protein, UspA family [Hymenobacter mucosus]